MERKRALPLFFGFLLLLSSCDKVGNTRLVNFFLTEECHKCIKYRNTKALDDVYYAKVVRETESELFINALESDIVFQKQKHIDEGIFPFEIQNGKFEYSYTTDRKNVLAVTSEKSGSLKVTFNEKQYELYQQKNGEYFIVRDYSNTFYSNCQTGESYFLGETRHLKWNKLILVTSIAILMIVFGLLANDSRYESFGILSSLLGLLIILILSFTVFLQLIGNLLLYIALLFVALIIILFVVLARSEHYR